MKALALLVPVAFALALTLPGVSREGYSHEDEWRNAVMAREMVATGPVMHPRLHGVLYPDYPPLYFWAAIPVARAEGALTPLAVRLPSVLGAALIAFGTALLALRAGRPRTALAAGVLVSVIPLLHLEERRAMIDPLFTGFATLAVALLARPETPARREGLRFALGCLALALTWLTKGPLGAVVVGLALAGGEGVLLVTDRGAGGKTLLARAGLLLAFVVLLGALWFGYAYATYGREFGDNLLYEQTVGRFLPKHNPQHEQRWHFYLGTTIPGLLPLLAFGLVTALRTRLSRFALGWFVLTLVFFSACNTKRSYYLMPAYPAVALLAAGFFEVELSPFARALWQNALSWALAVTAVLGVLAGFYAKELRDFGLAIALAALLGSAAFHLLRARRKPALAVAAASAFVLAAVSATVIPALARRKGQKELARDVAAKLPGMKHVAVAPGGIHREALCFFFAPDATHGMENVESHTNGADAAQVVKWLERFPPGEAAVVIHRRDHEGALNELAPGSRLVLLATSDEEASSDDFVVLALRR